MPKKTDWPAEAEAAGFEVRMLHEGYSDPDGTAYPALYQVDGHGASLSLTDDATEVWESLLGHAEAAANIDPEAEPPNPQEPEPVPIPEPSPEPPPPDTQPPEEET